MRLHRKHGVAPTLTSCVICGKEGNSLLLLGADADKTMRELHEQTGGAVGSAEGYTGSSSQRVPILYEKFPNDKMIVDIAC